MNISDNPEFDEISTLEDLTLRITGAISMVAVTGILLGAIITVADVLGRWFFGTAVYALNEIMSLTFAVAVAATMPAGAAGRKSLRIDLLTHMTSYKLSGFLKVVGSLMLFAFFSVLAWNIAHLAVRYEEMGRATALLMLPLYPVYYAISACMTIAAIVQLINTWVDIKELMSIRTNNTSHPIVLVLFSVAFLIVGGIAVISLVDVDIIADFIFESPSKAVLIGFGLLWLCVFLQIPLASVTASIGVIGASYLLGIDASAATFAGDAGDFLRKEAISTLPLFLIMGAFAVVAGVSADLFQLGHVLLGRFRGGMAYATLAGCAGFGAVTGNSVVTSATFGRMALPEMERLGYDQKLATASVAAGGTLGALVPPSGVIILFALLTEASIGTLFIAAMIPAILAVLLYFAVVMVVVRMNPDIAPAAGQASFKEIRKAFLGAGPVVAMFTIVIGGLYGGIFTVTESAAVGAACAFFLALFRGRLNRRTILRVFADTTGTVMMIYSLIFGGLMFSFFINLTGAPDLIAEWIANIDAAPLTVLIVLVLIYLLLGSVMDSHGVMIITLPVVTPIVLGLGYDMIFWGILMLVVVEIGMISPPFGMNLFIIKNIDPRIKLSTVMRGITPFVIADLVKIVLLIAFPALSLWLPSTMN